VPAESCASLAADGLIYFDSDRADFNRDIYVVHPDSSGLTRLTEDPADDREPSISRDGKTLAFTSTRAGSAQIFLLDVATGDVAQLTHHEGGAAQASISPDGQQVAFHSGFSVFVIGIDGSDEREVDKGQDTSTAYSWPQFSADGGTLIFDRLNQITALALDGSRRLDIVQNWTTTIQAPAVSPTGTEIAYQVACDGPMLSVWTSPTGRENQPCRDGRRVTPLSDREASQPTWGPSSLLAFESKNSAGTSARIAVISREPGVVSCMATDGGWDDRNPSWFVPR
jgi:Tol biopolymer transport system component